MRRIVPWTCRSEPRLRGISAGADSQALFLDVRSLVRTRVSIKEETMANPVPAGSDVSAGTYRCTNCGNQIDVGSTKHLPPCPSCGNGEYETVSGGDSINDPYPDG
jgi:Zn finger protein HypA/HybF involved in hydrogenase expression